MPVSPAAGLRRPSLPRQRPAEILAIKEQVRARDGFACIRCGMTSERHYERYHRALNVHRKQPGTYYALDGCETVCIPCHATLPKLKPGEMDMALQRPGRTIMVWISPELSEALNDYLATLELKPTRTAILKTALKELLQSAGFWPSA